MVWVNQLDLFKVYYIKKKFDPVSYFCLFHAGSAAYLLLVSLLNCGGHCQFSPRYLLLII